MKKPLIVVTGSTGTVGREVVKQLVEADQPVRVLVRDPAKAKTLFGTTVEIVKGDLAEPDTLGKAFSGAQKAFVLAPPVPEIEVMEKNAFEAAVEAGAKRIVFLSNHGAGEFGSDYHFLAHAANERRLASLNVDWTVLKPSRYMNYLPFVWSSVFQRNLLLEADGDGVMTAIAPSDVAAVGVLALTTDGHEGQKYIITSEDSFTAIQLSNLLSKALNRKLTIFKGDKKALRTALIECGAPPEYAPLMANYFSTVRAGNWKVTDTASKLLGRKPQSYAQWLDLNLPKILKTFGQVKTH